jgi:hypothetical protein
MRESGFELIYQKMCVTKSALRLILIKKILGDYLLLSRNYLGNYRLFIKISGKVREFGEGK